ncbi:hypothetical protein SLA2020_351540 [Shorea laevis]
MDVCGDHGNRIACSRCARTNFHYEVVYTKELTAYDMKDSSRIYVSVAAAQRICPEALISLQIILMRILFSVTLISFAFQWPSKENQVDANSSEGGESLLGRRA